MAVDYEQLSVAGTAVGLAVPTGQRAFIVVSGAAVRYRDDGVDPTASIGVPVAAGQAFVVTGPLSALKFIAQSGTATLDVFYGQNVMPQFQTGGSTVSVVGALDTELAAAAALTDTDDPALAVPSVGARQVIYDAAAVKWKRTLSGVVTPGAALIEQGVIPNAKGKTHNAVSIGAGVNSDVDLAVAGYRRLYLVARITASASGDLTLNAYAYEDDGTTVQNAAALTALASSAPTFNSPTTYTNKSFDLNGFEKLRIRVTNNNAGAQTATCSYFLQR